jgi:putative ABC transport system permease protein
MAAVHLAVHIGGGSDAFVPRLRGIAAETDPALHLGNVARLGAADSAETQLLQLALAVASTVSFVALLLSLTGIYSVLSFIVLRRTREIGIRVALGGDAWRVIVAIFRRPMIPVLVGIVAGAGLAAMFMFAYYDEGLSLVQTGLLLTYAATMMGVCLLAAIVPTRRALRVQPAEALRMDA